ncbi:MAG: hypothetical protein J0H43_07965, partial [Actinobacteria bacterium]|nr:hypothetical protein [Actinomycetota bacterium]
MALISGGFVVAGAAFSDAYASTTQPSGPPQSDQAQVVNQQAVPNAIRANDPVGNLVQNLQNLTTNVVQSVISTPRTMVPLQSTNPASTADGHDNGSATASSTVPSAGTVLGSSSPAASTAEQHVVTPASVPAHVNSAPTSAVVISGKSTAGSSVSGTGSATTTS